MVGEWSTSRVEDVLDVTDFVANGSFESLRNNVTYSSTPDYAILVRLVDYNAQWNGDFVYVNRDSYDFLQKSTLKPGDVVIANVGANAGTVFRVPDLSRPMTLGPNAVLCKPKDENTLCRGFLYYFLISGEGQGSLLSILSGSAQPKFNKTDFRALAIPIPPILEQLAIAHILGTLDDKIELNRRMNETLEAMARALFKSWFVDFDPVRAKMDAHWRKGESLPGLPAHLYDLFPDRLVDSELGEIPEGWGVRTIGDLLELAYGKALKADDRHHGEVPVYGSNGQVGWHNEGLAQGPGVVVGRKGNPGVVTWVPTDFFVIDTAFYVVPKGTCRSLRFLFHALMAQDLASLGADSAVPGLNRNLAYMSLQVLPPLPILQRFDEVTKPLCELVHACSQESRSLAALRDTLLPKLISGQLRVDDSKGIRGEMS